MRNGTLYLESQSRSRDFIVLRLGAKPGKSTNCHNPVRGIILF